MDPRILFLDAGTYGRNDGSRLMFHTEHYTFSPCSLLNSMQVRLENHLTLVG
jgi:hypothetical protein